MSGLNPAPATASGSGTTRPHLPPPLAAEENEPVWGNETVQAEAVIWGTQLAQNMKKLRALTASRALAFQASRGGPGKKAEECGVEALCEGTNSMRIKPQKKARKGKKQKSADENSGVSGTSTVVQESVVSRDVEYAGTSVDMAQGAYNLNDVANYECVESTDFQRDSLKKKRKRNSSGEKPNSTYTEMIATALEERPEGLTVSEIYDYISREHPYFQADDDRWKNSVRHNLSITPFFQKGEKAMYGAGHVWTIKDNWHLIPPTGGQMTSNEATTKEDTGLKAESGDDDVTFVGEVLRNPNGGTTGVIQIVDHHDKEQATEEVFPSCFTVSESKEGEVPTIETGILTEVELALELQRIEANLACQSTQE